ncbi:MAG: hypothetical protein K2O62_04745 [Clostridia bacterium]|nr:hypothetical protein [Clostridia bacterium]
MNYRFTYKGIVRDLPVYEVGGGLKIAYLDSFCDFELVKALSQDMAEAIAENHRFQSAERVVILTAVSKGVPFAYTVANALSQACADKRIEIAVARKENKKFYGKVVTVGKTSITSAEGGDLLVLAENEVKKLHGANVVLLDDMYSTGASLKALEELANTCGATVIDSVVAVWETGDESLTPPVKYMAKLPLIK